MKMRALLPAAALAAALAMNPARTWADDEEAELNDLPAAVQKTAHEEIGASKVEEVEDTYEEGQHATEVEYHENGKKMAVVIAADGTLIQKEYRMSPSDAPAVIEKAVAGLYPDGTITHIKEVERKTGKFFEISVKVGESSHRLKLDDGGKALK
ncbi:MAG: hypothetical protein ABSE62_14330 [Chthoniobacteraceae bacterium]